MPFGSERLFFSKQGSCSVNIAVLRALLDVSKALNSNIQLDSILSVIVDHTIKILKADRGRLFLYDERKNELWSKITHGIKTKKINVPIGKGIVGDVAKTRTPCNVDNALDDPRFDPHFDLKKGCCAHSVLCYPLINSNAKLIGVLQVFNKTNSNKKFFTKYDEFFIEALSAHAVSALERGSMTEAYVEREKLQETLNKAAEIQLSMLPKRSSSSMPNAKIWIHPYISLTKRVGGDFYDFFFIDDEHVCLVIGDVSGKGMSAALFMAKTHTLIRLIAKSSIEPHNILKRTNDELSLENEYAMFASVFLGVLNIQTGVFRYSNAGHHPPFLLPKNEPVRTLPVLPGLLLGLKEGVDYVSYDYRLGNDDIIFLYTDGLTDARNNEGEQKSEEDIRKALDNIGDSNLKTITNSIVKEFLDFSHEEMQYDDVTILSLKYRKKN